MIDDFKIIDRVLTGSLQDFELLIERHKDYVMSVCVSVLKNTQDAEEASQDSFIKAYKKLTSFDKTSKFSTWLYRIAYRTSLDHLRKRKRTVNIEDHSAQLKEEDRVHSKLLDEERFGILQSVIETLDEEDRTIIRLFYFEEMQVRDLAKITGLKENNIKIKLFRIRKKLKERISPELKKLYLP